MIPIFEQGRGEGIGHSVATFTDRFEGLCREHVREGRARAFAFIFYDFGDPAFRAILKSQGVFAQLDRLAGNDLSIFYLHSARRRVVEGFNAAFLEKLSVAGNIRLPCLVFFRVGDGGISDVAVAQLESATLIHGFHELYGLVDRYIKEELAENPTESKYVRWLKSGAKLVSVEAFRAWLKAALEGLL